MSARDEIVGRNSNEAQEESDDREESTISALSVPFQRDKSHCELTNRLMTYTNILPEYNHGRLLQCSTFGKQNSRA